MDSDGRSGPYGPDGDERRETLLPKHGGYRRLKSFQLAQLVYDVTVLFCDHYIEKRSRTHDQMVQAARSGVQNIAEGSVASGTSKKTELKLTNVARASLAELHLDYEDYLRQRRLPCWPHDDPRSAELIARRCANLDDIAKWAREIFYQANPRLSSSTLSTRSTSSIKSINTGYPEIIANAALVLIRIAMSLLARQIRAQAIAFEHEGGITERLYRVRQQRRNSP